MNRRRQTNINRLELKKNINHLQLQSLGTTAVLCINSDKFLNQNIITLISLRDLCKSINSSETVSKYNKGSFETEIKQNIGLHMGVIIYSLRK